MAVSLQELLQDNGQSNELEDDENHVSCLTWKALDRFTKKYIWKQLEQILRALDEEYETGMVSMAETFKKGSAR